MRKNPKIAFIGGGNMGGAIIRGFVDNGTVAPENISVCCKTSARYAFFSELGVSTASSISEAVDGASYIFLCVKPADIARAVFEACSSDTLSDTAVFVSVAASVSTEMICKYGGKDLPVIRTMPGMPLLVGEGTVAVSRNRFVSNQSFQYICRLFSSIALVSVLDEELMNPIISVNGSSPAYVFFFVKSMLRGAQELGIDSQHALPLVLQTLVGAAKMLENSDLSIDEQISRICSPRGTTLEAMSVLEESDIQDVIIRAMKACSRRADEITAELQT